MACSFTSSAGGKRVRPWDSCQDVDKLKEMLEEREGELECFTKHKPSMEDNVDAVQRLHDTLLNRDIRIEELLSELEKAKAMAAASGNVFCNPSLTKSRTSGSVDSAVRRNASRKVRCVASDIEDHDEENIGEGVDTDDDDYVAETVAADSIDGEGDDDDEDDLPCGKGKSLHGLANVKKSKTNVNQFLSYATKSSLNVDPSKLRASIRSQILKQMVYRPGLKYSKGKVVAEVPNLSEGDVKAIVGDELFPKGKSKGKFIRVNASKDEVEELFGEYTKGLRYGATLDLVDGLKFAFERGTGILKVTGTFKMF